MRSAGQNDLKSGYWSGRLALQVEGRQAQSFSAAFELRGSAEAGELSFTTPIGATVAVLNWSPGRAMLRAQGEVKEYGSLDALVRESTGAPIPVAALFDWLAGIDSPVPGWRADLSELALGRMRAQRSDPQPPVDLRVVLDPR